jgi:hypothetical protein
MSKQIEFSEIDFEAIEYRNEYRHKKKVLALVAWEALTLPIDLMWLFGDDKLWALIAVINIGLLPLTLAECFIQYKSRVIITGQGLLLKQPLRKDVEIPYSEIGELQINGIVIKEGDDIDFLATDLSEARWIWDLERINSLKIRSRDGKKKIVINQSLENFERFCDDLAERRRLAIDRYMGYAKGTSLRQPERHLKTLETLKTQREEGLLKARAPSEIQKVGAAKSE